MKGIYTPTVALTNYFFIINSINFSLYLLLLATIVCLMCKLCIYYTYFRSYSVEIINNA